MNPDLHTLLAHQHHVATAAEAARVGVAAQQLSQAVAHGDLVRLARGAYADAAVFRSGSDRRQHCLLARCVLATLPGGLALSHHSAAALWDLPWLGRFPSRVHVARERPGQHRHSATHTIHRDGVGEGMQQIEGLRVVDPAYALLGIAAHHGFKQAVVAMDAALHSQTLDIARLDAAIETQRHRAGHRVLTAARQVADAASESPGETLTRLLLRDFGYAARSQVEITAHSPAFRARVDFMLTHHRVVLEFDGLVKYADATGREALVREKAREDRLRALGFEVVRLVWADLHHPDRVRALIEGACRRASRPAA